jgi:hypothetical protein
MGSPLKVGLIGLANISFIGAMYAPLPALADIVISSAATNNINCSSGVCTPTSPDAVLNVGDLQGMLATSNITLAAAGQPVDVDIEASLSWVSTNSLTIDSYHSINVNQPVAITGGGGLSLITNDGGTTGVFDFSPGASVVFWSLSSNLTIDGSAYTLVDDVATLASDVAASPNGFFALAGNYDAGPDGTYSSSPIPTLSGGTIQGLGNTISNLSMSFAAKTQKTNGFCGVNNEGTISNINLESASIDIRGNESSDGGIVGVNSGVLFGDHVEGSIIADFRPTAGGIAGVNNGSVTASSASATLVGTNYSALGGLVGENKGTISESYSAGSGTAKTLGTVGGLVAANNNGTIINSYATGEAKGADSTVAGGLIGIFQGGTITDSYSTGSARSKTTDYAGGLLGQIDENITITNSYWDKTTSKNKDAAGGIKNISGVTGETTTKLQAGLPAGFDPTIWAENPSINNGLPYLIANPPQ